MGAEVIGFWGGMALLISSITGPGLTTIPLLFQQAGWLTPTIAFLIFGGISGAVSLFLVETMSTIHGNESFQARVEYATVAHLYIGNKIHIVMQVLLYCALQSVNLSSIIISEQTMDSLLIRLFHKTCAVSFTEGWVCATEVSGAGSPFDSYILFSFGYLISAALVLPLSMMSLVGNIKFQLASVAILFFVMVSWIYLFASHGLNMEVPMFGYSQSTLVGFVLNNFAFITTVPSFVNELSRHVSIHKSITWPIVICVILYLVVGLTGAASFNLSNSSDILATLSASTDNKTLITIVNVLFPIAVLITSVPVFAIVIRYNLVRGGFCSNSWAIVWASLVPWVVIIPFQTKGWLILIMNWSALIFGSSTNFIIPLVLYLSSKIYTASTVDTTGGDLFVLHRESPASSIRRSLSGRSTRRSFSVLPTVVISETDVEPSSMSNISVPPQVVISSPKSSKDDLDEEEKTFKHYMELEIAEGRPEASSSALDPNTIPLRVIYSPSVSRSASLVHSDRPPSITVYRETEPGDEIQLPQFDNDSGQAMSYQAASLSGSNIHRRSRTNSHASNVDVEVRNSLQASVAAQRSASPVSRLAFEESGPRDYVHAPTVFVAFRQTKWFRPILVAKIILAFVCCAVLANLIYTIIATAQGDSPLSG